MKNVTFAFLIFLSAHQLTGQDVNNMPLHHMRLEHGRKHINVPDIMGYKTLKCDFHMHTIFSDGIVWPEVRVQEAWEEGLDAISITDHIENQPSKPFIKGDHNSSYDVSVEKAKQLDIILIKGGEITREMPPGHFNALFMDDVNALDTETPMQAIEAAIKQGAFIEWNHPGWKAQQPDTCIWWPVHEELYQKGWLHGIEVFNEKEWYPIVLDWCRDKDLAVIGNSDIHDVTGHYYDIDNGNRPMTLVFAKERSMESIKEAMFDKRTVAYYDDKLAGKPEFLEAIFNASLTITKNTEQATDKYDVYFIANNSDIPFYLSNKEFGNIKALANRTTMVRLPKGLTEITVLVNNLHVTSTGQLETIIKL